MPRTTAKWALVAILVLFYWRDASAWIGRVSFWMLPLRSVKLSMVSDSVCITERLKWQNILLKNEGVASVRKA